MAKKIELPEPIVAALERAPSPEDVTADDHIVFPGSGFWAASDKADVRARMEAMYDPEFAAIGHWHSVDWDFGPFAEESGDLMAVWGIFPKTVTIDGRTERMHRRVTYVLRRDDGEWKLIHEHYSRPRNREYQQFNFLNEDASVVTYDPQA